MDGKIQFAMALVSLALVFGFVFVMAQPTNANPIADQPAPETPDYGSCGGVQGCRTTCGCGCGGNPSNCGCGE